MNSSNLLKSWVNVAADSDFSMYNFPFGIFKSKTNSRKGVASAIGNYVVDLAALQELGCFSIVTDSSILKANFLNPLIQHGKAVTNSIRKSLQDIFEQSDSCGLKAKQNQFLIPMEEVDLLLPFEVGDYTDFFSSREHATNTGSMFRDPANALLPNWLHLPVGYHGRSSSIVVSGTPIHRPKGQILPPDGSPNPFFSSTQRLDFELEMGFVVGKETQIGECISTAEAEDYIFGLSLFNDWSARDIQQWEYVPLGPFLGKNFASSISPWVVTLEALEPFRMDGPVQDPKVLQYLEFEGKKNYDIHLEVWIQPENGAATRVSLSNFKYMYWNMCQQLAHHTVNGCNVRVGDLMASGTISGPTPDSYGSMLEIAWKGTKPIQLSDGTERKFIQNGDTVILKGWCEKEGIRVGFGEVSGKIVV